MSLELPRIGRLLSARRKGAEKPAGRQERMLLDSSNDAPDQPSYNRLRDLVRDDIIEGRLASGSRLKIAELAARYRSSGIPVREALQQLQGEGIVIFTPNRGARVRQIDEAFLRNIYEIRALLEPFLIRWFARHRSEAELEQMAAVQREYDQAAELNLTFECMAINKRFHDICYNRHYNDEALTVAFRHNALIRALARRFPPGRARNQRAGQEHWEIIERSRLHDEAGAAAVVEAHVRDAGRDLIERMLATGRAELSRSGAPAAARRRREPSPALL